MDQNNVLLQTLINAMTQTTKQEEKKALVKIVPSESKQLIRPSKNNPDYGHVVLRQLETGQSGRRWIKTDKRQCLMLGTIDELKSWLEDKKSGIIPGRIVKQEYREDEVPEDIIKDFFGNMQENNPDMFEEQYERLVKRAGNEGPELISDNQRILTFSFLDPTMEEEDVIVKHDNTGEISDFNKIKREQEHAKRVEELKQKEAEMIASKAIVETVVEPVAVTVDAVTETAKPDKKANLPG